MAAPGGHGDGRSPSVVVMGVSGVGKTTTARLLAEHLGLGFADADDFHSSANVAKMSAGTPLDDADRGPWLAAIGRWLSEHQQSGGVIACSALKRSYRDTLRAAAPEVFFIQLTAERERLIEQMQRRGDHYMPVSLLDSQLRALEPLDAAEAGVVLRVDGAPTEVVEMAADALRHRYR